MKCFSGRSRTFSAVSSTSLVEVARAQFDRRPVRYSMVSAVAVVCGQSLLFLFQQVLDMTPVAANILAVSISSVPSYLLNRAWVWGKRGSHHLWREVVPFWAMAFLGLAFSTVLVHYASEWSDAWWVANLASLAAFGTLWVVKYLILDGLMFGPGHHTPDDEPEPVIS
jgi:putative flippase GtrA